jgi:hypothetical protein
MRIRAPRSLRTKLLGVVLLTTFVALAVALSAVVAYDLRDYHRTWTDDMSTQAELLGRMTAPALAFDDANAAKENLSLLRLRPQVRAAAVYGTRGNLFASYVAAATKDNAFPSLPDADVVRVSNHDLVVFKRIVEHGEILGTVYLRADYPLYEKVLSYVEIAIAVTLLAMLVASRSRFSPSRRSPGKWSCDATTRDARPS